MKQTWLNFVNKKTLLFSLSMGLLMAVIQLLSDRYWHQLGQIGLSPLIAVYFSALCALAAALASNSFRKALSLFLYTSVATFVFTTGAKIILEYLSGNEVILNVGWAGYALLSTYSLMMIFPWIIFIPLGYFFKLFFRRVPQKS